MSSLAKAYASVTAGMHAEFPISAGIPQELEAVLNRRLYVEKLRIERGFWYLATPYAKWHLGHADAFRRAAKLGGQLLAKGVVCFTPIAHSHPMAEECAELGHADHSIWMPFDKQFVDAAYGIIVADMPGWQESKGVAMEIAWAREAKKPIWLLNPESHAIQLMS